MSRSASYSTHAKRTQKVAPPSRAAPRTSSRCWRGRGRAGRSRRRAGDHRDADRDVDEEDQPPAEVRAAERDQHAADERADRRAEPDRRTEDAEGPAAVGAAEHLLHQARDLRVDQPAEQALQDAGADQDPGGRGEPGRAAEVTHEAGDADLEHQPAAVVVAELAAEHRHQAEGQRVAADDPLELRRCRRPVASPIEGSATLVTLTSSSVMNIALQQTTSAIQRLRSASGVTRWILPEACGEQARWGTTGARCSPYAPVAGAIRTAPSPTRARLVDDLAVRLGGPARPPGALAEQHQRGRQDHQPDQRWRRSGSRRPARRPSSSSRSCSG